jgi:hypothetical protein
MNSWEDRLANEISKRIAQFIERFEAAKGRLEAEAPGAAAEPFERKEPEEPRSNSHVAHFTRAGAPAGKDD